MSHRPPPSSTPPRPQRRPKRIVQHGVERIDPYAWLRAENWREVMEDPGRLPKEIRDHLEAENAHADAWFAPVRFLISDLEGEMRGRIAEDDASLPVRDGPWAYIERYRTGGDYPILARRAVDPATGNLAEVEEILFDGDKESAGSAYFDLAGGDHSPDHQLFAYAVDRKGSELYEIRIRDLETGRDLPDRIRNTSGDFVWAMDGRTLFYVERDDDHRPSRVRRHVVGQTGGVDPVVYVELDRAFFVGVSISESRRFLMIETNDHVTSEVHLLDADRPDGALRCVARRRPGVEYDLAHVGDWFYVLTNADGAEDFEIRRAPVSAPGPENWAPWVPHRPGVLLLGQTVFARHHVRIEREDALPRIVIRRLADDAEHQIAVPGEVSSLGLEPTLTFETTTLRFGEATPTTPDQVFDYDMESRARRRLKTRPVPSGHEPSDYVARRLSATAPDGEAVPVTLLHHRLTPIDGTAPAFVVGYGAYGETEPADFRTGRLSLVDRGMVFAIAHVRGSMARGYRWYREGKLEHKENSFLDYIAVCEALIGAGYTGAGRIVGYGGSAGGLLIGAVLNRRPELFAGAILGAPFLDVLNTMSDASLPLTEPEWIEWGDPVKDPAAFTRIAGYSPYENVGPRAYPPIYATGGLADPRVLYWEPAKWIAAVRDHTTARNPALLEIDLDAGHQGASGRWDSLNEVAREFAFALAVTGIAERAPFPKHANAPAGFTAP